MLENRTILSVSNVFEGELRPGYIQGPTGGRIRDGFLYLYTGRVQYLLNDYSFTVAAGQMFYLSKNSVYTMHVTEPTKFICVDLHMAAVDTAPRCEVLKDVSSTVKNEFEKLFYLFNQKQPWRCAEMMGIVYRLYTAAIKAQNRRYDKTNRMFSQTVTYILQNLADPLLSVKTVATFAGMSETHLRRIFKTAVNTSPVRYITFLRLEKAKNMLLNSNYSIEEIAVSVGIPDPYYFSRLFKREIGVAPSQYRNKKNRSLP